MIDITTLILTLLILGLLTLQFKQKSGGISMPMRRQRKDEVILDSCALIDGRVVDLVRSGFLRSELIIPRSVIAELQHLADHGDTYKRERARYGLDVAKQLQEATSVIVSTESLDASVPVDERLIALGKQRGAALYTTDFNLNKVAQIEGVQVLNINELSQYLRPHVLPGETRELKIIDKGQDRQQGVGYLPDGTMVVVEGASSKVGKTLQVEFTRMLQTQAGRMMFATIHQSQSQSQSHSQSQPQTHTQPNGHRRGGRRPSVPTSQSL